MTFVLTTTDWLGKPDSQQIYNGMDCCLTLEILDAIAPSGGNAQSSLAYSFSRAMQGPILDIMQRGFAVDHSQRILFAERFRAELAILERHLNQLAFAIWDKPLNARSAVQLQQFFYKHMNIPEIWTSKKGKTSLSMDRDVLEKLENYYRAIPFVSHILAIREKAKTLEVLECRTDADGRMRSSYNIAGTETGRLSSSSSAFGTGGNLQNITGALRRIFVADQGYRLCVIDLEQAESREVGWLCGKIFDDWAYLDACESGDLHTLTAKLIWPKLGWSGDKKSDRTLADTKFYRDFSYRDMSKRGGHGCIPLDYKVMAQGALSDYLITLDDAIRLGCPIKVYDPKLGDFSYEIPSSWCVYNQMDEIYVLECSKFQILLTPRHRIVYYEDQLCTSWKDIEAQDFNQVNPKGFLVLANGQLCPLSLFSVTKISLNEHQFVPVGCPTVSTGVFVVFDPKTEIGHVTGNSNYFGKPFTMARHLKLPTSFMTDFQSRYFGVFPAIPKWHRWTAEQLQTTQTLTNAFGISRLFFDRPNDETTLRAAIAHSPQSSTAYRTNLALYRIWKNLPVQVLAQTHDSVTFQYLEHFDEPALIAEALRLMEVELEYKGRKFVIPGEAKIGYNWGNWSPSNPDGLRKWAGPKSGRDPRERQLGLLTTYE